MLVNGSRKTYVINVEYCGTCVILWDCCGTNFFYIVGLVWINLCFWDSMYIIRSAGTFIFLVIFFNSIYEKQKIYCTDGHTGSQTTGRGSLNGTSQEAFVVIG